MNNQATIFTLEAMAILEALNIIGNRQENEFYIFSDSKSVLQALSSTQK